MTPLAEKLAARIRANGPMTVADYMTACLGDPEHGYYLRREPFGRAGDFVTAPEVSQMFGELIGAWAVATWAAMGAPSPFVLAELGPGRGTLVADLLRAGSIRPGFCAAAQVHLVETSPRLRDVQRATLAGVGLLPIWHEGIDGLPAGPAILIANEFFDALPVRQFARTADGWAERMVGLDESGGLAFGLRTVAPGEYPSQALLATAARSKQNYLPHKGGEAATGSASPLVGEAGMPRSASADRMAFRERGTGDTFETSPASTAIMEALAARLANDGGAALVIDYGYEGPATGDTLQAVRGHRYDDPLAAPGEADLTAHVDFAALAAAARAGGAVPRPLMSQGDFLLKLGILERAGRLGADKDAETQADLRTAVERLCGPDAMGTLFKVLAVSEPGLAVAVFDGDDPKAD